MGEISRRADQRHRGHRHQHRQQRRDRDRDLSRPSGRRRGREQQLQAGDRQVDEPRPVDVGAGQAVLLARSYQPWPSSRPRTCIIRILSSVSPSAKPRIAPSARRAEGGEAEPEQSEPPAPLPVHEIERPPASPGITVSFLFKPSAGISRCRQRASGGRNAARMKQLIEADIRNCCGQLVRFGLVGGFVTELVAGVYWVRATGSRRRAACSPTCSAILVATVPRLCPAQPLELPRPWQRATMPRARTGRFFIVSLVSLGLNSLFVFILAGQACSAARSGGRSSRSLFVTPLVTFSLNRRWVFG